MSTQDSNPAEKVDETDGHRRGRLDSWKEIALYLNRDVRTVRRWEKEQGLPVHRHQHQKSASIYAYRSEVDQWWRSGQERRAQDPVDAAEEAAAARESENFEEIPSAEPPRWRTAARLAGASLSVIALTGLTYFFLSPTRAAQPPASSRKMALAVLPFENLTGEPGQEFVSDGLTEEMIAEISGLQHNQLSVIARTSSMAYKSTTKPVSQIGRELGVEYVLEGSVRRWGDRVRVTAQLIQTRDQTHVWAQNFESDRRDVLRLQSEIAKAIAEEIRITLTGNEVARLDSAQAVDPRVYELCLLGRFEWNKRNQAGLAKAVSYFQQAIERDPNYAPAYAGLAEAYLVTAYYGHSPPKQMFEKAQAMAEHALLLNDETFQAHATVGLVKSSKLKSGAEIEFKRALAINPSYATAHHWYAFYLWRAGRRDEAFAEVERARQLDPVSPIIYTDDAVFHLSAGETDEAIRLLKRAIDLDPQFSDAHRSLAVAYVQQKNFSAAMAEAQRAVELNPSNLGVRATLGYVEAVRGEREQAQAILEQLKTAGDHGTPSFFQAWLYVGLGEDDKALECLEKEYRERSPMMVAIAVEPIFQPLRRNARFLDLLARIQKDD